MATISTLAASLACVMILSSCSKELNKQQPAPEPQASGQILNVTLNADEVYSVAYDKATELNIFKQASHFQESLTSLNNETGQVIYKYIPKAGFTGADQVTLSSVKTVENSNTSGCYHGNYGDQQNVLLMKTYTTVKINVK